MKLSLSLSKDVEYNVIVYHYELFTKTQKGYLLDYFLDKLGISATTICAIHCIMLPVILPALPVLGLGVLADAHWERVYLLATVMLGFVALFAGFKKYHRSLFPFYLLALGGIIFWVKHDLPLALQNFAVVGGAILVIGAHVINVKLCKSCKQCEQEGGCAT